MNDLSTLKPGDEVAILVRRREYVRDQVDRRTPSGQIVMVSGSRFNSDGVECNPMFRPMANQVVIITDENRDQIEADGLKRMILEKWRFVDLAKLSNRDLGTIHELLSKAQTDE